MPIQLFAPELDANSIVPDAKFAQLKSLFVNTGVAAQGSSFGGGVTVVQVLEIVKFPVLVPVVQYATYT